MYSMITSSMHGKLISVEGTRADPRTPIIINERQYGPPVNQLFYLQLVDKDRFWIRSALNPQMVLEIDAARCFAGTPVTLNNCKTPPEPHQLFKWTDEKFESCAQTTGNLVLEIKQGSPHSGAALILAEPKFGPSCNHQRWRLNFP